jgi:hypothetical protein
LSRRRLFKSGPSRYPGLRNLLCLSILVDESNAFPSSSPPFFFALRYLHVSQGKPESPQGKSRVLLTHVPRLEAVYLLCSKLTQFNRLGGGWPASTMYSVPLVSVEDACSNQARVIESSWIPSFFLVLGTFGFYFIISTSSWIEYPFSHVFPYGPRSYTNPANMWTTISLKRSGVSQGACQSLLVYSTWQSKGI